MIKQFENLIETIAVDEIGMKEKIKAEIEHLKKFNRIVLGNTEKITVCDIDVRNYAKYILKDGTDIEKRELLGCLRGKIILKNKTIGMS